MFVKPDSNTSFLGWLADRTNEIGLAWWVKVLTRSPQCTYYFGPFLTAAEADKEKAGYIDDLRSEGAEGIEAIVQRCRPENLTIDEDSPKKYLTALSV
ncbi:DUF1816 domain-containing protein [Candidatus Synechococcus calcipolaris G9]|uniref:DUF1816 domain-containing protein n=1 Tax=Candidatus Synechococcus calcipolaris G9 TaxID=1497997 RepID=A0ABT6EV63_9SYNE|nr:DUF1816 domain-containing protein [Candidatus Synechococcus calcipolaris G9]